MLLECAEVDEAVDQARSPTAWRLNTLSSAAEAETAMPPAAERVLDSRKGYYPKPGRDAYSILRERRVWRSGRRGAVVEQTLTTQDTVACDQLDSSEPRSTERLYNLASDELDTKREQQIQAAARAKERWRVARKAIRMKAALAKRRTTLSALQISSTPATRRAAALTSRTAVVALSEATTMPFLVEESQTMLAE